MFDFSSSHLFTRSRSSHKICPLPRGAVLVLLAVFGVGCSTGGTPLTTATCSSTSPCPAGLICVVDKGLCALPGAGSADLAAAAADLASSGSSDLALPPADLAGTTRDLAPPARDLGVETDLAMPSTDMGMPTDMAMPLDMRMAADLAMPPDMAMPPSGSRACPYEHFCWENPLPQPRSLNAVWGVSPSDLWTVGYNGVALHWNGTAWTQVPTGTEATLVAVWGRSASQMWVVGLSGTILYWDGTRFTAQPSGTTSTLRGIWGDASTVWAVGNGGTIVKWNGTIWATAPSGITNNLYSTWGSASSDVWAVGDNGMVCHFGGTAWTCGDEFSGNAMTIVGTARNDVWALGSMTEAWHWNGTAWAASARPAPSVLIYQAYALGPKSIWAVGANGTSWHYDGTSWTTATLDASGKTLYGVFATSASDLHVVGASGRILHYDGTWKTVSSGFIAKVTAMWGVSDRDQWIFTNDGNAHHFNGSSWATTVLPSIGYSVTGTSGSDIWVGSDFGRVFHYDGTSWTTIITRDTGAQINGIYIAAADRVVLAGDTSVQFWDGARYTISLSPSYAALSTWGTGPSDIWVGTASRCYTYHFDGSSWLMYPIGSCSGGSVTGIHGTSSNDVYFVGDASGLPSHWDGTRFTPITTPVSASAKLAVYATPTRVFFTTYAGEVIVGLGTSWSVAAQVRTPLQAIAGWSADKVWVGGDDGFVLSYKP